MSDATASLRIEFTDYLLPQRAQLLQYAVGRLVQFALAGKARAILLGDTLKKLPHGRMRVQPFGNQGVQEIFELPPFPDCPACHTFLNILRQAQRHLHGLLSAAHELLL